MTAKSLFSERFEYALWLYMARHGRAPTDTQIGEAVGRTQPAVAKWHVSEKAPPEYAPNDGERTAPIHGPLATYLEVPRDWLVYGEGEPPAPKLWEEFIHRRRYRGDSVATAKQRKRGT